MTGSFRAVVVDEVDGKQQVAVKSLKLGDLPEGDVLVDIAYSTVNYKDGLALTGRIPICRKFPMVAGIDLAGTVAQSASPEFKPGDRVLVNGYGLSERYWGGYSQRQRLRPEWLVRIPGAFDAKQAMAIGTAGYTAMLCVLELEHAGVRPGNGPVLVTGAGGGVGSVAIALLARLGYEVAASTGRAEIAAYLKGLGATTIVERATLAGKGKPIDAEQWAGAIDCVGGQTLANVLAQTRYDGAVAACGLAGGTDLPATVYPFILRDVALLGVDSVMAPMAKRVAAWDRLARDLDPALLDSMTTVEPLARTPELAADIVAGRTRGRVVIDVNA
ncbi:MAG: oxidoreductase [Gammaproteobacteria bacterium]|nr:oxidoreductase [Gammaproteobacteria bacterium]